MDSQASVNESASKEARAVDGDEDGGAGADADGDRSTAPSKPKGEAPRSPETCSRRERSWICVPSHFVSSLLPSECFHHHPLNALHFPHLIHHLQISHPTYQCRPTDQALNPRI